MVIYTIKNLLPLKDILKTVPSSGINNYIKILETQRSRKTAVKELGKIGVAYLINPTHNLGCCEFLGSSTAERIMV